MRILGMIISLLVLTSCASVYHGPRQSITVISRPSGAKVYVDGRFVGKAPVKLRLVRDKPHRISLTMVGHEVGLRELKPEFSSTAWFNFALGPGVFLGFLVDSLTGSIYQFEADKVNYQMVRQVSMPQVK